MEVGSAFLFGVGHAAEESMVLSYRSSIPAEIPPLHGAPGALRLTLVIPESGATALLYARLQTLPEGQGKQDRARLLAQVVQAGVNVLYRGVVLVAVDPMAPTLPKPDTTPSAPATPPLPKEMLGFMDNLSMDGLQ